jgi:hypothetical protein
VTITAHNSLASANAGTGVDTTPDAGDWLRATTSGWSNGPTSYTYVWERNTANFAGCTDSAGWSGYASATTAATFHVIGPVPVAPLWDPYRVSVTASNAGGSSSSSPGDCVIVSIF